jgi:hypothetical protein
MSILKKLGYLRFGNKAFELICSNSELVKLGKVFEIILSKSLANASNQAIYEGNDVQSSRLRLRAVATPQNYLKNHPKYAGLDSLIAIENFLSLLNKVVQSTEDDDPDVQRLEAQGIKFASFQHSRSDLLVMMEFVFRIDLGDYLQTAMGFC